MPSTKQVGQPGPNNGKIGGTPTVHYMDNYSRGRGQVVRLLFEDAGIAYEDVRYGQQEYSDKFKHSTIASLNPTATLPIVEINGKILTQSYPILRHFARQLEAYDGANDDEKYWVDLVCDITSDWRTLFTAAEHKADDYAKHCDGFRKEVLNALEKHLASHELSRDGPFVLGNNVTYTDLVLYQLLHDEGLTKEGRKGLQSLPRLKTLVDGVEDRPNVKAFLQSDRYLG